MMYALVVFVEEQQRTVLLRGMSVTTGYVMMSWISVLPSPKQMAPSVRIGCGVRRMMYALVVFVEEQQRTVLRQGMNAMTGYVMMSWISVLPSPKQMALPVMMGYIALRLMNVRVASAWEVVIPALMTDCSVMV